MNEFTLIKQNGTFYADSRDIAEMTEKQHFNLIRDIEGYIHILENSNLSSQKFFIPSTYKVEGNSKTYPCYLCTKKGCDMVANKMTGEKGVLFTAAYIQKFYEMEQRLQNPFVAKLPRNFAEALRLAADQQETITKQAAQIEEQKPKVLFAESVAVSKGTMLIRELAKLITQNGYDIGEKRLHKWLRDNGYLIKKSGKDYGKPTQRAAEMKLFEISETTINHNSGAITTRTTTRVTGKGQIYFVNLFKKMLKAKKADLIDLEDARQQREGASQ